MTDQQNETETYNSDKLDNAVDGLDRDVALTWLAESFESVTAQVAPMAYVIKGLMPHMGDATCWVFATRPDAVKDATNGALRLAIEHTEGFGRAWVQAKQDGQHRADGYPDRLATVLEAVKENCTAELLRRGLDPNEATDEERQQSEQTAQQVADEVIASAQQHASAGDSTE